MTEDRIPGVPATYIQDAARPVPWTCPYCNRPTTITDPNLHRSGDHVVLPNSEGGFVLQWCFVACPNQECKRTTLTVLLNQREATMAGAWPGLLLNAWVLMPESSAKTFSAEIPVAITADYEEACRIIYLSPKSATTLGRRCLQGMIRDFWGIKEDTLKKEVDALEGKVDEDVWKAIDAVRKVGNIAAHMEKDVNLVIDVEPDEAEKLIGLIELLVEEWYVRRDEKKKRVKGVIELAKLKDKQRHPEAEPEADGGPDVPMS